MIKNILSFIFVFLGIFALLNLLWGEKKDIDNGKVKYRENTTSAFDKIESLVKRFSSQLNHRQVEILKLYSKSRVILPSDIYSLHPDVSTRTLRRDMSSLVDLGLVIQEGTTRDTRYLLKA